MTGPAPPPSKKAPDSEPPTWRSVLKKAAPVAVTGITIYVLLPVLTRVFAAWPRLTSLVPGWAAIGLVAEVASFSCTFMLKRIALRTRAVFAVVTSGLVGNAVTNVFPGSDATGASVEFGMLSSAGIDAGDAIGGLTATALLQTGSVLALPVVALLAILAGARVSRGLLHLAFLGLGMFVLYGIAVFVVFRSDSVLRLLGRVAQSLRNHLLRHRPPMSDLPERLVAQRDSTRDALGAKWRQALLYTVGRVWLDFACLLAMLAATRARPEPWLVLIAYAATTVIALLPVTPGGIGLVEGSLAGLLILAGIPGPSAFLSTLGYRLVSYWLPTLSGPFAYFAFRRRYGHGAPVATPGSAGSVDPAAGPNGTVKAVEDPHRKA